MRRGGLVIVGLLVALLAACGPPGGGSVTATSTSAAGPPAATNPIGLGIHNYQTQDATSHLSPDVPLMVRRNCSPLMAEGLDIWQPLLDHMEGLPAIFDGCGAPPTAARYARGRMSPVHGTRDVFFPGSASTPRPRDYREWITGIRDRFGADVAMWEVWNEADAPAFYRGRPADLVELTFVAADVWGADRVIAPSFTPAAVRGPQPKSGAIVDGERLTREEFARQYWQDLVSESRRRGVGLPVAVAAIHGYGFGPTVEASAADRLVVLRRFKELVAGTGLPIWDTEWNLRSAGADPGTDGIGFPDTAANAAIWRESVVAAHCLGIERQYAYLWTDLPSTIGFEASQLQLNTRTPHLNAAYRALVSAPPPSCPAGSG